MGLEIVTGTQIIVMTAETLKIANLKADNCKEFVEGGYMLGEPNVFLTNVYKEMFAWLTRYKNFANKNAKR